MRTLILPIVVGLALSPAGCAPSHGHWHSSPNGLFTSTPELQGVESGALADAIDVAITHQLPIHELPMVRHGAVMLNTAFSPFPAASRHDIASITKSITSLLVGIAVHSGALRAANDERLPAQSRQPHDWRYHLATDTRRIREEPGYREPLAHR
jgi:CubicO group peptidase (beta-lactamase class C family)